ncbi:HNH endonuclease [Steroidobacter sp. S1-65]|uniref:HNH endonuclease n=1 Tax=Steroidobacter gossypii TaxID=2805490 RepID=A0ABS1WY11_9GAMM|nr:HNH endonuclease signature motif containing protein [Steroidobacter gossypii]MBM0105822.1 HNH endonuclease [Steroidobacter gossypii]
MANLTSRDAVLAALAECDALGRDVFLKRYGFKYSRLYPLRYNERVYDSKAIAGVAYGKQHGTPLRAGEFSGGLATVIPALKRLGFDADVAPHPLSRLGIGATYERKHLIEMFGGQLQSGIWTPREFPVVLLFSGKSGEQYGYKDQWTSDGVFRYTGEGQSGDMTFDKGNRAIRDHRSDKKDLLLFEDLGKGKGVRFAGVFECMSWSIVEGKSKRETSRKLIVFDLVPVATAATATPKPLPIPERAVSLSELRQRAYDAATIPAANGSARATRQTWYARSEQVRQYVLGRANGTCEACDQVAPFKRRDGTPYLEPHHTTRLADEGLDHPASVGAICPTCHRRIHSGEDGVAWNERLVKRITAKEQRFGPSTSEFSNPEAASPMHRRE